MLDASAMNPSIVLACTGLALLAIVSGVAYGSIYEDHGFYLEYPEDWTYTDDWDGQFTIAFAEDAYNGGTVTVTKQETYEVVLKFDRQYLESQEIIAGSLDMIVAGHQQACRSNTYGSCWDYQLLDGSVTTAGTKMALLTSYQATIKDEHLVVRTLIVPDGDHIWIVESRVSQDDHVSDKEAHDIILSFVPAGASRYTVADEHQVDEVMQRIRDGDSILLEKTIQVNLIMVGAQWSKHEISAISKEMPQQYEPLLTSLDEEVGVRYLYEFEFISEEESVDLAEYMFQNSFERPLYGTDLFDEPTWQGYWVAANHPEWMHYEQDGSEYRPIYDIAYRLVDAQKIEEYLYKTYVSPYSERNGPYTANLIFLKMDLEDVPYLRNYHVNSIDSASGKSAQYTGLMGYGGTYNMFFYDLYAAPWLDFDLDEFEYYIPPHAASLHDCADRRCEIELVTGHVGGALSHIVTPSLLYPIESHPKYLVDLLVYVMPGGRITITPASVERIMDTKVMLDELEYLYPYADWDLSVSVERRDTRGLTYEFKRTFDDQTTLTIPNPFSGARTLKLLNHTQLQPHLLEWSEKRAGSDMGAKSIPVLLAIDDSDIDVYLGTGFLGIAPGMANSESDPCCAMVVTDSDDVWESGIGPTNLVLHEVGHVLGLHHPFVSFDEYGADHYDKYYDWYASPMTYSSPVSAWTCGILYGLIYEERCGNASLSFTVFERERVSDARLLWLFREMGGDSSKEDGIREAVSRFLSGDILSERGALPIALNLYGQNRTN